MKRPRLVPSNKLYTLFLCCVLAAAAYYLPSSIGVLFAQDNMTRGGIPIIEKDGKTLLLAAGSIERGTAQYFDVTDALVNPRNFDHGIGKDQIPSIDAPAFITRDDPDFGQKTRMGDGTRVIGVEIDGEARAYPINIMSRHELVNDTFGEAHVTVAW